jgi:hypothetical protein|tara:strand:+ start:50 stop:283 length:234 start_codon:yes stop_codon:yes gene_type:complete
MKIFIERGISHIDLHGVKHKDVDNEILDFIYQNQDKLPLIIICGNSNKMIQIVSTTLKKVDIKFSSPRFGIMRIEKV